MIQVGTWRKFWRFLFLFFFAKGFCEVVPLDLVVCLRRQQNDTRGDGEGSRPMVGTGAREVCTGVRLLVLRPAGSPAARLPNWRLAAAFQPLTYSVRGCTTGSRHEFVLFCCVRLLAGWLTRRGWGGGGRAGAALVARSTTKDPGAFTPPDPPLAHLRRARG